MTKQFRLVQQYWGLETARRHCLPPGASLANYSVVADFISRKVSAAATLGAPKNPYRFKEEAETYSLTALLTGPASATTPICLIADAYEGKSILLEQTAYEIGQSESRLVPLLLRLKNTAVQPIEQLLENTFDGWLTIPAQQLVIIIDGLDEVPGDRFTDVVNHLFAFINRYGFIRMLFSCRKLFYHQYELPTRLTKVRFYELEPLSTRQTFDYLEQQLGAGKDTFYKRVQQLDLEPFLAYPFYLKNMVNWFKAGPVNMPASKIDVVNRFITESLDTSAQRRLSGGLDLDQRRDCYKRLMRSFALALQLAGTNALHYEDVQQLYEPADLELMRAGSLLSIEDKFWSFTNALYQEQLAALALQNLSPEKIVSVVSIGKKLQKIRLKWVQTLASYITLLPPGDPGRELVLQLIEQDNIELITVSDGSKFSPEFRLEVFKKIFDKYIAMSARPILATDAMLGSFSRNDGQITGYLFELLKSDIPEALKVTVCRTLTHMRLSKRQAGEFTTIASEQLATLTTAYYGELLLELITQYQLGSTEFTALLFGRKDLMETHEFRDGMYKYLMEMDLVDQYYELGLEGLAVLYRHNKDTNHFGSEMQIQDFLLSGREPANLIRLLNALCDNGWQEFYQYKAYETGRFMTRLTDLAVDSYRQDAAVLSAVVGFVLSLGRNHLKEEFKSIDRFFTETGTNKEALIIYLDRDGERLYSWELADLITRDCFPVLINYVQVGKLKRYDLDSYVGGLYYRGKREEGQELQTMIDDTFGKEPVNENGPGMLWQRAEENRKRNDYAYIQSVTAFREGVVKYFEAFGRQEIEEDELYLEPEVKPSLVDADSYYIQSYLRRSRTEGQRIYLSEVIALLEGPVDFEYWRVEKLLQYEFKGKPEEQRLLSILEAFYRQHIEEADFKNAYFYSEAGQPMRRWKEYQLAEIWKKHQFETSDEVLIAMTWMETGGVSAIRHDELNKRLSLAQMIADHFSDRPALLASGILGHLKSDVANDSVLASQIGLCKHLKIYEAAPLILAIILSDRFDHHHQYQAIDVYAELGGEKQELLDYLVMFKDYNDYVFIHLVKLLRKDFTAAVTEIMLPALAHGSTSTDRKLELAQQLATSGRLEGFDYIIGLLEGNKVAPIHIQHSAIIWEVDTAEGTKRIVPVDYMLVDPAYDFNKFWEAPRQFLIELLFGFSKKGEADLIIVEELFHRTAEKYKDDFPTQSKHLLWHSERALDQFRESGQAGFSIAAIRQIIREHFA
jgi:hypothetical protein